jgi:hypothetical protein
LNTFANLSGVGYPAQGSWSLPSSSIVADRVAVIALVAEKLVGIDGEPLTFDVTGEAHEVKGYEALIELHDVAEVQAWLASRRSAPIARAQHPARPDRL